MADSCRTIPSMPEAGWRIATALVGTAMFAGSVLIFLFLGDGRWNVAWVLLLGIFGLAAIVSLSSEYTEVHQPSGLIVKRSRLFGIVPIGSKTFRKSEFTHVKRHVARALVDNYKNRVNFGNRRLYRPAIYLEGAGRHVCLQVFKDTRDRYHPLSETWAARISNATRLPVLNVVETWDDA